METFNNVVLSYETCLSISAFSVYAIFPVNSSIFLYRKN